MASLPYTIKTQRIIKGLHKAMFFYEKIKIIVYKPL